MDVEEFQKFYSEKFESIYRYVYSKVGNREEAEDLTSEIFLKAARRIDQQFIAQAAVVGRAVREGNPGRHQPRLIEVPVVPILMPRNEAGGHRPFEKQRRRVHEDVVADDPRDAV